MLTPNAWKDEVYRGYRDLKDAVENKAKYVHLQNSLKRGAEMSGLFGGQGSEEPGRARALSQYRMLFGGGGYNPGQEGGFFGLNYIEQSLRNPAGLKMAERKKRKPGGGEDPVDTAAREEGKKEEPDTGLAGLPGFE